MIDPNYKLPKTAIVRLFDNPIPAGDPARADAPEWAHNLDYIDIYILLDVTPSGSLYLTFDAGNLGSTTIPVYIPE